MHERFCLADLERNLSLRRREELEIRELNSLHMYIYILSVALGNYS